MKQGNDATLNRRDGLRRDPTKTPFLVDARLTSKPKQLGLSEIN